MARVYGITKRLQENRIPADVIKDIIGDGNLIRIIQKMENILPKEMVYQILDSCSCGISIKEINNIKEIQAETLESKINGIALLNDFHSSWNIKLNVDQTITAGWIIKGNDKFSCACSAIMDKGKKVCEIPRNGQEMPLAYCFCCAGHCRRHLQKLLDLKLKTKEVICTPINSHGQKPCEFLFENDE